MRINKKHIAGWLSNMSVGTFIIGAFQAVEQLPWLGDKTKWLIICLAIVEFLISLYLAREE